MRLLTVSLPTKIAPVRGGGGAHGQGDGGVVTGGMEKTLRLFDLTNYHSGEDCVRERRR